MPKREFKVALTGDFYGSGGALRYRDIGLSVLEAQPGIRHSSFVEELAEIAPRQIGDAQAVIVLSPRVTARSLSESADLLMIGRFGVGFDSVDVEGCTAADVLLATAVGGVDRSVAEATLGWMLALAHHMLTKDRLVRDSRWSERGNYMGRELRDRRLGIIGFGGIGRALAQLVRGLGMLPTFAFDPFVDPGSTADVQLVPLDTLLRECDFVSVHCPLNDQTRNLLGARELALMKPDAYLINTARGGIIEEAALFDVLSERRIAGAALDCFVGEPLAAAPRFAELDNVILAPHSIAWTDEMFRDIGRTICRAVVEVALGRRPKGVINPAVLERAGFQQKWERLRLG